MKLALAAPISLRYYLGMPLPKTIHRRQRGRPPLPASERVATEKRRKADGERLNAALQLLDWTQAAAARRSGIRQGAINEMVNGSRHINREDLRRLGKAGIPPDFLLGLADTMVPVGATRAVADLHGDLAAHLVRQSITETSVPEPWLREALATLIDGKTIVAVQLRMMQHDMRDTADKLRRAHAAYVDLYRRCGIDAFGADDPIAQAITPKSQRGPRFADFDERIRAILRRAIDTSKQALDMERSSANHVERAAVIQKRKPSRSTRRKP